MFKKISQHKYVKVTILLLALLFTSFNNTQPRIHFSETPVFIHGERLTFRVRWGIVSGGEMTTSVRQRWHNGHEVYHAVVAGGTTGWAARAYTYHLSLESFFNPATNLPIRATSHNIDRDRRYTTDVSFNHEENYVICQRNGRVEVPPNTLDMAAVLYYIRRLDLSGLQMNQTFTLDTYFGNSIFPFHIEFRGRETITIGSGQYRCLKFVPVVEVGRVFENKDAMTVWISDDQNHIPVSMRFEVRWGSFKCDLTSFENLKYPLTSKIR